MAQAADLGARLAVYRFSLNELKIAGTIGFAMGGLDVVRGFLAQEHISRIIGHAGLLAIATAVVFAIIALFFSVEVFEQGLRGQTKSGRSLTIRWPDISRVDRRSFWGVSYATVTLRSGEQAWIPLWIVREDGFRDLVRTHAGSPDPFNERSRT